MALYHVSFPLQTPGERAGDVLADLERELGTALGLGSDSVVSADVDADSQDAATSKVLDAIIAINAGGYFDLHGLHQPMHISVRRYRLGAGTLAGLSARVDDGFAPLISEVPDFVAYHLIDAGGGEVVSIRIFGDPEALARSDELTDDWVREHLGEFRLKPVDSHEGDVLVSRRSR